MKFVLIMMIVYDVVVYPPWAVSVVAEFDDEPACKVAAERVLKGASQFNAKANFGCIPKSTEAQKK